MRSILVIVLPVANLAVPAYAQTAEAPITTRVHAEEGEYLVDAAGMSLYLFKADLRGGDGQAKSTCEDDCLAAWPPLLAEGGVAVAGSVNPDLLGTVTRSDGSVQVTYGGWPLYYYAQDFAPGDINGHDIDDFGEDWYLIGPNGERARD